MKMVICAYIGKWRINNQRRKKSRSFEGRIEESKQTKFA